MYFIDVMEAPKLSPYLADEVRSMDSQSRDEAIRGAAPHMLAWVWLLVGGLVCLWGGVRLR